MLNIIKLYYKYVFSKKVIIIFLLVNIAFIISLLYSSGISEGYYYIDMYRDSFQEIFYSDFVLIVKILTVIFNVFLVSMIFKESCGNLSKYIIDKPIKKLKLVFAKLIFVISVGILFVSILFLYFFIIYTYLTPFALVKSSFIGLYLDVLIQNICYILITFFLLSVLPTFITALIPISLFWYTEFNQVVISGDENILLKFVQDYIPIIEPINGAFHLRGTPVNYLYFDITLVLVITLINLNKDT